MAALTCLSCSLFFKTFSSLPLVSISDSQRRPAPNARWAATIHHGMPENLLTPIPAEPRYLAFLGRISPEKRVDRAIQIAIRAGLPLKIAAKVDAADVDYFEEQFRPLLAHDNIEFIGEIGDVQKPEFLSGAMALIVPIDWPEPFGIVMIEAMACGTPVIAFNRGLSSRGDRGWRDRLHRRRRNECGRRGPSLITALKAANSQAF